MIYKVKDVVYVTAIVLLLCSCNRGGGNVMDCDRKIQYVPQENEVTVIVLKKEVFCRNILSNGKLSAALKAPTDRPSSESEWLHAPKAAKAK